MSLVPPDQLAELVAGFELLLEPEQLTSSMASEPLDHDWLWLGTLGATHVGTLGATHAIGPAGRLRRKLSALAGARAIAILDGTCTT